MKLTEMKPVEIEREIATAWAETAGPVLRTCFWLGLVWAVVGLTCILVAERWMGHDQHGDYGRLVFYQTWGPIALGGAVVATASFCIGRRRARQSPAAGRQR